MPSISASAPGKLILVGEHAVVYGRPAIAAPVTAVRARAVVMAEPRHAAGEVRIDAPDVGISAYLDDLAENDPLAAALRLTLASLAISRPPACTVRVSSTIPIASGLGSGAAVSIAMIRAFSSFLGHPLSDERVSTLSFEIEQLHHGTPSGIDNSVIAYHQPIFFVRDQPVEFLHVPVPFTVVIADTGIQSPTRAAVGEVRKAWGSDPGKLEALFDEIALIVNRARNLIEAGEPWKLGALLNRNHELLCKMGVSSPDLDRLVDIARKAGALGAKLSGAGRGGNMIALVDEEEGSRVSKALLIGGAVRVINTQIKTGGGQK